ncbi:uncharacterized protein BXZ73DRAFT_11060, partial [Epithele typhae]|uniref:uncharacterized protein n=1 Tax=Epithele typhae TaxID=378194 RepID=UPI002007AA1D
STSHRVVDAEGRIMMQMVPSPANADNTGWNQSMDDLVGLIREVREDSTFQISSGRRGDFSSITTGISMGQGSLRPGRLLLKPWEKLADERLRASPGLRRLAGYQSYTMAYAFPKAYGHLYETLDDYILQHPDACMNFPGASIYSGMTVNLGPLTCCSTHLDSMNYPGIPCVVTSLGRFNHQVGAQMNYPRLKMVVDFPSYSSIYMPSAGVDHGNTLLPGRYTPGLNERASVTQYVAGGLMRYCALGYRKVNDLRDLRDDVDPPGQNFTELLGRYSTTESLEDDRKSVL